MSTATATATKWVYDFAEGSRDMRELLGGKAGAAAKPGGGECAGEVVRVGEGVTGFAPGNRVMGRCAGGFAEHARKRLAVVFHGQTVARLSLDGRPLTLAGNAFDFANDGQGFQIQAELGEQ